MPLHPIERELVKLNMMIEALDEAPTVTDQVAFLLGVEVDDDFRQCFGRALISAEKTSQERAYEEAAGTTRRAAAWCGLTLGVQFAVAALRADGRILYVDDDGRSIEGP